uniref:RGM domain family member B n=2 Tax=Cacopsylla melanoneura TaxID=428564 RepID=A0A8D8YBE5_9HEMI
MTRLRGCWDDWPHAGRPVMDWTYIPIFLVLAVVFLSGSSNTSPMCKVESCTRLYELSMEQQGIQGPESTSEYCTILHEYGNCVKGTHKACRGDLSYHSALSMYNSINKRICHKGPHEVTVRPPVSSTTELPPTQPPASCNFHGTRRFKHCGLFGDPHLKTFNNDYQTCRVRGAWPLIDNPYLGVQVTNELIREGSPATVTTKVTVLIKGRSTPCTSERTYEAQADSPLPLSFINSGSTGLSNTAENVVLTVESDPSGNHERAEIFIRYIETTIIVRRVGKYLAVSAKLPEELVEPSIQDPNTLQLCTLGCPPSERLDIVTSRGHMTDRDHALAKCKSTEELSNDIVNNLTDYYLDWCVFDTMTAGISYDFTAAAHSAQADVLRFDPNSLNNRTTLYLTEPVNLPDNTSAGQLIRLDLLLIIGLFILVRIC